MAIVTDPDTLPDGTIEISSACYWRTKKERWIRMLINRATGLVVVDISRDNGKSPIEVLKSNANEAPLYNLQEGNVKPDSFFHTSLDSGRGVYLSINLETGLVIVRVVAENGLRESEVLRINANEVNLRPMGGGTEG